MGIGSNRCFKLLAVAFLVSVFAGGAQGRTELAAPPPGTAGNGAILNLLTSAYETLAMADHDYKGHRVRAMKAIKLACTELGTDISGNGKGHEKQPISDEQLAAAEQAVQKACAIAASQNLKKVVRHLTKAVEELNEALAVR